MGGRDDDDGDVDGDQQKGEIGFLDMARGVVDGRAQVFNILDRGDPERRDVSGWLNNLMRISYGN